MPVASFNSGIVATMRGASGLSTSTITRPLSAPMKTQRPATEIDRAPLSAPPGLNVTRARQEVVRRIGVGERGDVDEDQSLFAVGDVGVFVERMNRLFFVLRDELRLAIRIDRHRRRQRDRRWRISSSRTCAGRAARPARDDALGEVLVVDVGDVVDARSLPRRSRL